MDCARVREQIELFVLGGCEADSAAAVRAHLQRCAPCRRIERDCRRLVHEIREDGAAGVPRVRPGFARSLQSAVREEVLRGARRRVGRWIALGASAAACLVIAFAAWRLGAYRGESPPTSVSPTPAVMHLWQKGHASAVRMSTADAFLHQGENLYVLLEAGSRQTHLAALDGRTGERKWESPLPTRGYLAADAGRVYCLVPDGRRRLALAALSAADGAELWRFGQDGSRPLRSPCRPVVLAGRVCWTTAASVHMIRATDGQVLWSRTIADDGLLSAPARLGDQLVVAGATTLYGLGAATGEIVRRLPLDGGTSRFSRPLLAASGGRVYVLLRAASDGRLICLAPEARAPLWTRNVGATYHLLATAERLYVRGRDVQAIDPATGGPLWRHEGPGCGPVTLAEGILYCVDSADGGRLVALNGETGATVWRLDGYASCNAFVKAGRLGYLKTRDGIVYAMAFRG